MLRLSSLTGLILMIEPDERASVRITSALEHVGLKAVTFPDARAISEALSLHRPNLVLAEFLTHRLDGLSLYLRLREQGYLGPVVLMSSTSTPMDRAIGLRLGIDDWVSKPVHMDELVARIQAILRRVAQPNHKEGARAARTQLNPPV